MKRSIILMIILIAVVGLFAQPERQMGKPDVKTIMEQYTKRLNLTENQQEAIEPLIEEHVNLMEKFHSEDHRGNREDVVEFQTQNDNIVKNINSHLDKNQQVEYKKMREEMKQNRGRKPGRNR